MKPWTLVLQDIGGAPCLYKAVNVRENVPRSPEEELAESFILNA